jgi:hypothetical protein
LGNSFDLGQKRTETETEKNGGEKKTGFWEILSGGGAGTRKSEKQFSHDDPVLL